MSGRMRSEPRKRDLTVRARRPKEPEVLLARTARSRTDRILILQRTYGNQAIARMIRSGRAPAVRGRLGPNRIRRTGLGRSWALASLGPVHRVQRAAAQEQGASETLTPVLGGEAIATLQRYLPAVRAQYGRVVDFAPLENELVLGGLTSQLLRFQPSYKLVAVRQYIDAEKKKGWEHLRFPGTTISEKTPQQWYVEVNRNRRIPADDKRRVHAVIYAAFVLRAVRDAVQLKGWSEQRFAHGQAPVSGDYGNVLLFRVLVEELASRMPRNLAFNENRFGRYLLQITGNRPTRGNVPHFLNPPETKPDQTLTFGQLLHLIKRRSLFSRISFWGPVPMIKNSQEMLEEWASTASVKSLVSAVLSARSEVPNHWELTLGARDITPSELAGLVAKEQQRATQALRPPG